MIKVGDRFRWHAPPLQIVTITSERGNEWSIKWDTWRMDYRPLFLAKSSIINAINNKEWIPLIDPIDSLIEELGE